MLLQPCNFAASIFAMADYSPASFYQQQIQQLTSALALLKKQHALLGWARLLTIVLILLSTYFLWPRAIVITFIAVIGIAIFLYLVSIALATEEKISNTNRLLFINKEELQILNGQYLQRPDGAEYINTFHLPDNDLDLFGTASLFQYINRAHSHHGRLALAQAFIASTTKNKVIEKQEAVKELSQKPLWCKQLQSYSMIAPVTKETETLIAEWLQDDVDAFGKLIWQILRFAVPIVSFTTLALYLADIITDGLFNTIMLLMLAFVFSFYKKITKQYSQLSKVTPQLHAFLPTLQWIETASFHSSLLKNKQELLLHPQLRTRSQKNKRL